MTALNLDTYSLSLITAKEDILGDRTSTDWAVFTYEKRWSLKLLDSGVGGLEELNKKLNKNLIQYGLCRVSDPNTGVRRVILVHWVGENVDAIQREVTAQHLPSIRKFFKEADVLLEAQKVEDITQEVVAQALSRVPPPGRTSQKARTSGSPDMVGTKYLKTNPAAEMKISKREAFWQRSEREEERRKETERLRLQEERIALERERIERERQEEEERERRIEAKERLVEEQRKEQARLEAERRRMEKERWAQQQKEYEEELKGRLKRSQSIEMAAEAAALVSGRSLHPRDFFRQQERSLSGSFSPPSTPSSPSKASSGFFSRTTLRYQRSVTESILTPTSRSPGFFQGFQKRDSFSSASASSPPTCSPAFIFSKSSLPVTSPKVDSLPSFIPPPMTAIRVTPTQVKGAPPLHTPPRTGSEDLPFRAEYVTVSPAEHNAKARPQHQDLHSEDTSARSAPLYRAELVAVDAALTSPSEVQKVPHEITKSPTNLTAIKSAVSVSAPETEVAPITEAKIAPAPQSTEKVLPIPPSALRVIQPSTSAADITPPTPASQVLLAPALSTQEGINKTSNINFCSNGTVMSTNLTKMDTFAMSTNLALSHEPKMFSGSTSLVSLLAPIPYNPYRTQRTDSSSLRSSSSAVPSSQHALLPSLETPPLVTFSIPSLEASPSSDVESSTISLECKYPALGKVTQNSSTTTSPVPVSVCSAGGSPESRVNLIHTNILIPESSSSTVPTEISDELQSHAFQADDLLPVPSPISSSLPTKSSAGPNLYNIHADVPLVQSSHEPPSITTEGTSVQLNVHADVPLIEPTYEPPSITPGTLSGQLNVHADIPLIEPTYEPPSITPGTLSGQLNVHADVPLIEPTYEPPSITPGTLSGQLNVQADTPGIEPSHEHPSKTTEGSSGQLNDPAPIPLMESSSVSSWITAEDSSGPINVKSNILLTELSNEPPSKTTEGSSYQLNAQALLESSSGSSSIITEESSIQINVQSDIPLLELAYEPPSITNEGSSGPLNVQANILLMQSSAEPSWINADRSSGSQLTNIQTDIPLLESSSDSSYITTEGPFEELCVQVDSLLVEPTYKFPSITTEGSSDQLNIQADIQLIKSSSESSWITTEDVSGSQLNNIQTDIPLLELSYEPSSITTGTLSGQLNVQADIPGIEPSHEPPSKTTEGSSGQLNDQAPIPLMESSSVSSWITAEDSSGQINVKADILLTELSHEPPSKTTEGSSHQLNAQADIPSKESSEVIHECSDEGSSETHLDNIPADIPLIETSPEPSSIINEGSSSQLNIQADIKKMESSSECAWITIEGSSVHLVNNIQGVIPSVELSYEPLSKTAEEPSDQPNVQADMPVMDCPSEPSWIISEGSSGPQLDNIYTDISLIETSPEPSSINNEGSSCQLNIQADIEMMECSCESSWITTDGSSGPLINNIQADIPSLELSYAPLSKTTEGTSDQLHFQADMPVMGCPSESSWTTSEGTSGPQLDNINVDILLIEASHEPSSIITEGSTGQLNIQADIEMTECSCESSWITTEGSSGHLISNIQADIPYVELSYEPLSKTTEEPSDQLNVQAYMAVMDCPSEPLSITSEGSSGPQFDNIHTDILLIETSPEPSSIINEGSSCQLNIQADIPKMESSSECSWITTEGSSGHLINNIQADIPSVELSYEPLSQITEGPSDQLNVQPDMPVMDNPSEPLSITSEGYSGPQMDKINVDILSIETSHEPSCIITEGSIGQLNVEADIPLMESSSESLWISIKGSSRSQFDNTQTDMQFTEPLFLLPESSTEPQSINIQAESSSEPSFITTKSCSGAQLNNVQADSPLQEPPSVSSFLSSQRSFGPQCNNTKAEAEPPPITLEACSVPQLDDTQADISLLESSLVCPSLPTESLAEPQININQESALLLETFSISMPCQSSGEPQGNNMQANIQSSPVLLLPSEISTKPQPENIQPISLPPVSSPVSPSVQTTISSESHPNDTLTDISRMGSLPASSCPATEGSSESQPNNIQRDIQLAEPLPISSSIPTKRPVELHLNDNQPKIVLGKPSPPPTESSTASQPFETYLPEQESPSTSSIVTPESQPNNKSGAQSPESMVPSVVPFTENSPESQTNDVQSACLVQESLSIPTDVSSELQTNYMEADILPLEPLPAPPTAAELYFVQTDPPLTDSSFIGEFSPIAIEISAEPLPCNVHKDISLTETSSGSSPPFTENIPGSQTSNNNENSPWIFSVPICSAEEDLLNTIEMEKPLTESAPVSTCPAANISDHDGKPNCSNSDVPSDEISLLPIPFLEDVLSNQFPPPFLPSDRSTESPLRSSSPSCETVFAEKVILFEDPHPGSPPVNGNLVVMESVPTDDPGELKEKLAGNVLDNVPVHDVQSSSNVIVAEDPVSDPKLVPSCEQLLKQFSNPSEALL